MIIINIDTSGNPGSGKTTAINLITRALKSRFTVEKVEYLNDSENQVRITATLKR